MHQKNIIKAGQQLSQATKALIMIHGRGGTAEDILSLSTHLNVKDYALLAPQAANNSWYPFSFLAAPAENEPWLSSALQVIEDTVAEITDSGIAKDNIYLLGFSQGACLTLEFATRNAAKYGGVVAFTGGLIGDKIYAKNYTGDFADTPIFIGTSNPDPHVPVERVQSTAAIVKDMHADLTLKIYNTMGHTISQDEVNLVNEIIFNNTK